MAVTPIVRLGLVLASHVLMCKADGAAGKELADPLGKVSELLGELKAKIIKEGEAEAKAYKEFFQWCHTARDNLYYEIKGAETVKEKQEAKVAEFASEIEVAVSKVEELSGAIATSQSQLKEATGIRDKEHANFAESEKVLLEASDALSRARSLVEAEMAKNPAALAQIDKGTMSSVLLSLGSVVDAAGVSSSDRDKLLAFVQSREDEEDDISAPYQSQSGDIANLLADLNEKAEDQLAAVRKAEANAQHSFDMMKQNLEMQIAADTKDMDVQKSEKASAEDEKAQTEGDLSVTSAHLEGSKKSSETFGNDCMQGAADHEATIAARTEELKVLTKAMEVLKEEASAAGEISRGIFEKYSFLQTASLAKATMQTRADLANTEAAAMIKKLAREQHSAALSQLASRISVLLKYRVHHGVGPFEKIKTLISQMIGKLEREAEAEATEKAWCDEQMETTETKKGELEPAHAKLVNKIDKAATHESELKDQMASLSGEIASLSKVILEERTIRAEEHANYLQAKADLESGMAGVRRVADILVKYYGDSASFVQQPAAPQHHEKASGAGGSIIEILEVVESDFAKTLTKEEGQEEDAQAQFEQKKDNKLQLEQELAYTKREIAKIEKHLSELTNDKETLGSELSAVLQYYGKVKGRCVAKPHTYEERKARREAEISGLKEALSNLESAVSFTQRKRRMRGGVAALQ